MSDIADCRAEVGRLQRKRAIEAQATVQALVNRAVQFRDVARLVNEACCAQGLACAEIPARTVSTAVRVVREVADSIEQLARDEIASIGEPLDEELEAALSKSKQVLP